MTRIVQLANFYGPHTGGLKTVVDELARCYTAAGVERVLIAPGQSDAEESGPNGRRIFVRAPVVPATGGYRMILRRRDVLGLLDGVGPDAVEVSDKLTLLPAARWARRHGIRCTLLSHERIDAILHGRVPGFVPLGRAADTWNRMLARNFDTIVCPSRFASQEFARIGAANAVVVPWGVDLDMFSPDASGGAAPRKAFLELICVGRLSEEKEPGLAVEVASELHRRGLDVHLTMVGTGPLQPELQRRAKTAPVTFTGHLHSRREIARLLAAADVTLAPCRAETFGLAVLESLACGTPVVTADSGAGFEVCGPGVGVSAPPDVAAMADAVTVLLAGDRDTVRRRARARATQFPWTGTATAVMAAHFGDQEERLCA
jgi:alpha-1,6-mannosyltransferase